jgi:hypothetical protein
MKIIGNKIISNNTYSNHSSLNPQKIKSLKTNKSYFLVAESFGYGQILEICQDKKIGMKRIQRYFDLQFNQIDPDFDINTEFSCLRNYKYPENTYLENSPLLHFQVSNGVNSVYVIEIDENHNIDNVVHHLMTIRYD